MADEHITRLSGGDFNGMHIPDPNWLHLPDQWLEIRDVTGRSHMYKIHSNTVARHDDDHEAWNTRGLVYQWWEVKE